MKLWRPVLVLVGLAGVLIARVWTDQTLEPLQSPVQDALTLSIGLLVESLPFVILGIGLSIVVQVFVPDSWLVRWLPRNPFRRRAVISLFGMFLPVCECGNVPLARGLMGRGYSVGDSVAFLLAAPIVNPVTIITTHQAFGFDDGILVARLLAGYAIANLVGWLLSLHPQPELLLTRKFTRECRPPGDPKDQTKLVQVGHMFYTESATLMPALIVGSLVAGFIQVGVSREALITLGTDPIISVLAMLFLAFVISVCANVDAFFILPFAQTFLPGSLVAFLVFGPLVDIKMLSLLRTTYAGRTVGVIAGVVGLASLSLGMVMNYVG